VDRPNTDAGLLTFGQTVLQKATASLNPAPASVAALGAALPPFATALENAKAMRGTKDTLTTARQAVVDALNQLKADVQTVARKQPPDVGKETIASVGFRVKKVATRTKLPFAVDYGGLMGTALLVALAVARDATYFWEMSSDQKVWVDLPSTMKAKTTATGLTPATVYYFRFRAQTRKAMGDWSTVVSYIAR
jgi:hypothetical protein